MQYFIITYGCQMNEADSELMSGLLQRAGWQEATTRDDADLIVINTCSVRERPEHKVYSLLGELRPWKQGRSEAILVVSGCMAQRAGEQILSRAPHVDIVLGTRAFHHIEEFISRVQAGERPLLAVDQDDDPSTARCGPDLNLLTAPLRAFVPIIRGCTNFCTYCIVPYVRGPEASRPVSEIVGEVASLVERGTREVTLLGQNVLAYGRDSTDDRAFADLLQALGNVEGLWRIRFTTCHPRDVTPDLVETMAGLPQVCEHIHLPIQAGNDRLLAEMNRGYTTAHYVKLTQELRGRVPGLALTTDIMVGFPSETEEEFEESLHLYEHIGFDAAFMFAYSPRPGTAAAERADQVPRQVRLERLGRLIELQNAITLDRNKAEVGQRAELLVDGPATRGAGLLAGRARSHKQVIFPGDAALSGSLIQVALTEAHLWGFRAKVLEPT